MSLCGKSLVVYLILSFEKCVTNIVLLQVLLRHCQIKWVKPIILLCVNSITELNTFYLGGVFLRLGMGDILVKKFKLVILSTVMVLLLAACGGGDKDEAGKVVVSGKKYTEQIILANIISEYLEANTDLEVVTEDALGSSFVLQQALEKGEIDMYVELTGTGLEILELEFDPNMTSEEIYDFTREKYEEEFNITWLEPLGFNNTYTLAMSPELYEELGIETYSELKELTPELSLGGTPEFMERSDGYDGLMEAYDFEPFEDKITLDADLMYQAAKDGEVDLITAFATEARIDQFNLKVLEDDQGFFPPFDAGIVIRQEILDANPGLEEELNNLAGLIDDDRMRELNGRVNLDGKKDKDVAIEFLKEEGFID